MTLPALHLSLSPYHSHFSPPLKLLQIFFSLFFTSLPAFYQYLSPPLPSSVLLLSVFALLFIFLSLYKEMFPLFSSSLLHLIHLTGVCSLALGFSLSCSKMFRNNTCNLLVMAYCLSPSLFLSLSRSEREKLCRKLERRLETRGVLAGGNNSVPPHSLPDPLPPPPCVRAPSHIFSPYPCQMVFCPSAFLGCCLYISSVDLSLCVQCRAGCLSVSLIMSCVAPSVCIFHSSIFFPPDPIFFDTDLGSSSMGYADAP